MRKGQHKFTFNDGVFGQIDTQEKAYWHGLLSADGHANVKQFSLGLQASIKDEVLGDRLIKFLEAPKYIKTYRIKKPDKYHAKDREYKYFSIVVYSQKLVKDFLFHSKIKFGENSKKADRLTLPEFNDEKLNMAWILGYYDGDGSEKTARINSSSLKLLEQIKQKYAIPFNIERNKNVYILYVGEYFREMLCKNYDNSLARKRVVINGRIKREKNKSLDILTKEKLEDLVLSNSMSEIGTMFNISRVSVFSKAKRLGIKIPKRKGGRKCNEEKRNVKK